MIICSPRASPTLPQTSIDHIPEHALLTVLLDGYCLIHSYGCASSANECLGSNSWEDGISPSPSPDPPWSGVDERQADFLFLLEVQQGNEKGLGSN